MASRSPTTTTKSPPVGGAKDLHAHFDEIAREVARLSGRPATFIVAALLVVVWAATGPLFGYSDTWQLVINTSTTIITFLMVFLIQSTQNRDTLALQAKLAELIFTVQGASDDIALAEDLSEEELELLHNHHSERAAAAKRLLDRSRSDATSVSGSQ